MPTDRVAPSGLHADLYMGAPAALTSGRGGRKRSLRRPNTSRCFLMALAVACLTFAAMPSAACAGGSGSFTHRSAHGYAQDSRAGRLGVVNLHRAFSFREPRRTQKFGRHFDGSRKHARLKRHRNHKGSKRLRFARHHRRGHHYVYASRYYDRYARYDRDRYKPRRDAGDAAGSYDPAPQTIANRPPSFKWIHVGALDGDARSLGESAPSEDGALLSNCLSVRTQITVDGAPMEAIGKACIQGDGTWRLVPGEPAQY